MASQAYHPTTQPSAWRQHLAEPIVEGICWAGVILVALALMFLLGLYGRAQFELQEHMNQEHRSGSAMVCVEGKMTYGDNSLTDRAFKAGRFVCAEWRTTYGTSYDNLDPRESRPAR